MMERCYADLSRSYGLIEKGKGDSTAEKKMVGSNRDFTIPTPSMSFGYEQKRGNIINMDIRKEIGAQRENKNQTGKRKKQQESRGRMQSESRKEPRPHQQEVQEVSTPSWKIQYLNARMNMKLFVLK